MRRRQQEKRPCRHCNDHGWVYVPVRVGGVSTIQRVRCNCPRGKDARRCAG